MTRKYAPKDRKKKQFEWKNVFAHFWIKLVVTDSTLAVVWNLALFIENETVFVLSNTLKNCKYLLQGTWRDLSATNETIQNKY